MPKSSQTIKPSQAQEDIVVFKEINNSKNRYVNAALKIYTDSFPPNERQSTQVVKERLDSGKSRMFIGLIQEKVVMMGLLFNLSERDFILLDYMAVSDKYRSKGIGTLFINHLKQLLKKTGQYLVLEVENPEHGHNKQQRKSRIEFYRSNGAATLKNVRYVLPPLDGKKSTEMNLMLLPKYSQPAMKRAIVLNLVLKIYMEVYNRSKADPLVKSVCNEIPQTIHFI